MSERKTHGGLLKVEVVDKAEAVVELLTTEVTQM